MNNPELRAWMDDDDDDDWAYMKSDPNITGPNCSICLDDKYKIYNELNDDAVDGDDAVWFNSENANCKKHIFHRKCVMNVDGCPMCRNKTKNIKEIFINYHLMAASFNKNNTIRM